MESDNYNERSYVQIIIGHKQTNELMQNHHMIKRKPVLDILARGRCLTRGDPVFCSDC